MSVVKIIHVKNLLAAKVRKPGGPTVAQAIAAAEAAVAELKGPTLSAIDGMIEDLAGLVAARSADDLDRIYALGSNILDLGGVFDERPLVEAATSLCDLMNHLRDGGAADWASMDVHVRALRLVRCTEGQALDAVLDGLRQVTERAGRA